MGRVHSHQTIAKRANSLRGRKYSDETRKKLADASRGFKKSPETIAKMSASMKVGKARFRKRDAAGRYIKVIA